MQAVFEECFYIRCLIPSTQLSRKSTEYLIYELVQVFGSWLLFAACVSLNDEDKRLFSTTRFYCAPKR